MRRALAVCLEHRTDDGPVLAVGVAPAGGLATVSDVEERRHLGLAQLGREGAARVEPASGRRRDEARRLAAGAARAGRQVIGVGRRRDEQLGVRMLRVLRDGLGIARLDDPARVHHHRAVGEIPGRRDVMGDVEDGDAEPVAEVAQQIQDAEADGHVEHRDRLVGEQHLAGRRRAHARWRRAGAGRRRARAGTCRCSARRASAGRGRAARGARPRARRPCSRPRWMRRLRVRM